MTAENRISFAPVVIRKVGRAPLRRVRVEVGGNGGATTAELSFQVKTVTVFIDE
jgi:hypothetical protein